MRTDRNKETGWKSRLKHGFMLLAALSLLAGGCAASARGLSAEFSAPAPTPSATFAALRAGTVERDIPYCSPDGNPQEMDIYFPAHAEAPWPALVYIHGGGWRVGDKSRGAGQLDFDELLARGYLIASINYRLAPKHPMPAMIEDAKCAVRFLRAHAGDYHLDPDRIGVWGSSAGGHLAAMLGVAGQQAGFDIGEYAGYSSHVSAVAIYYAPSDLPAMPQAEKPRRLYEGVFGVDDPPEELLKRYSPVAYIDGDEPPFLLFHGSEDNLVPLAQSHILLAALKTAGVPAELVVIENAGHSFRPTLAGKITPPREQITRQMADFFDDYLK